MLIHTYIQCYHVFSSRGCIKDLKTLINDVLYGISVITGIIVEHLLIMSTYDNQVLCQTTMNIINEVCTLKLTLFSASYYDNC